MTKTEALDTIVDTLTDAGITHHVEFFGAVTVPLADGSTLAITNEGRSYEIGRYEDFSSDDEAVEFWMDLDVLAVLAIVNQWSKMAAEVDAETR